jgi:ABC-2 type transport system ATP-binding protein
MIVVDQVHKRFGSVHAVKGVSFALVPGQIAGLLGHNGAGKTTTIRMITSCIMPDAGSVRVGDFDTAVSRHDAMRLLGYLPEATPLYHEMPVTDYLHYRGRLWNMKRADRTKAIDRVVERCWLKDVRSRRIGTLSKGYKQRVGLASALLHNPPVLVLDEPTNGLDPTQVHETRSLVRELATDRTVLLSSHILPEVEKLCDRVIIIAGGVVKADGAPKELAQATGLSGILVEASPRDTRREAAHALAAEIAGLAGVTRVAQQWMPDAALGQSDRATPSDVWTCFVQTQASDTRELRDWIGARATTLGVALRTLQERSASLEQVFVHASEKSVPRAEASPLSTSTALASSTATTSDAAMHTSWTAARASSDAPSEQQLRLRARLDAAAAAAEKEPPGGPL